METYQYNAGIRIQALTGMKLDTAVPIMPTGYAKAFIGIVRSALDELEKIGSGKALLAQIAATGHRTTIYFGEGAITSPVPETEESKNARVLTRLIPETSITTANSQGTKTMWRRAVTRKPLVTELKRTLDRAAYAGLKRPMVAKLLGLDSEEELIEIEQLKRKVTPSQYFLLMVHLYQWINPGPGCSTSIRFDATAHPRHADKSIYQRDYQKSALHIVLGHELIHAWRMMSGRRFYQGGFEEEQMTVGLPPFANMRFTENKLRAESGFAIAPKYGTYGGGTNSPLAEGLRQVVENEDKKLWIEFLALASERRAQHQSPQLQIAKGKSTWI